MPKIVKIKRTNVAGSTPTLSYGEVAYNAADNKLFAGNAANQAVVVGAGGGGGGGGIVEATTAAGFPATGSVGTMYHATDSSKIYFWDASGVYVEAGTSGGGGSGSFTLPTASDSVLGGIKVGSGLTIADGVLSAAGDLFLRSLFVPAAPTSVTPTRGNSLATLSWTAPTGVISQAPITDYVVQYSSTSGSTWTTFSDGTSTSTSATVTGLTNGTAYVFRVAAVNAVGQGAWSSASSAVTPIDAFVPVAVLLTSGTTSYSVPSGATSMKAWAVGGGGNGAGAWAAGAAGGVAYKTWNVTSGSSVSMSIAAGISGNTSDRAGDDTNVTYSGTTITGGGGGGFDNGFTSGSYSGGDGGWGNVYASGVSDQSGSGNGVSGGAIGGNGSVQSCGRKIATDVSGLLAAVSLAGGKTTEDCGTVAAFGSGAFTGGNPGGTLARNGKNAGYGGGGNAFAGGYNGGGYAGAGAVVLYFT